MEGTVVNGDDGPGPSLSEQQEVAMEEFMRMPPNIDIAGFMRRNWRILRPIVADPSWRGPASTWRRADLIGMLGYWADLDRGLATEVFHRLSDEEVRQNVTSFGCRVTSFLLSNRDRAGCQRMIDASRIESIVVTEIAVLLFDADPLFASGLDWSRVDQINIIACDGCKTRKIDTVAGLIAVAKWVSLIRVRLCAQGCPDEYGECVHDVSKMSQCPVNGTGLEKLFASLSREGMSPCSFCFDYKLVIGGAKDFDDLLSILARARCIYNVFFTQLLFSDYQPTREEIDASLYGACVRHNCLLPLLYMSCRFDNGVEFIVHAFHRLNISRDAFMLMCDR
jgi:hypothetical protein